MGSFRERRYNPFIREVRAFGLTFHGGRALSAMQLPWFSRLPPGGFGVLTTTGRKTGRPRRKCIRAMRHENRVYIVAIKGDGTAWLENLRTNPEVSLRIRGGTFVGRAQALEDPQAFAQGERTYCERVNSFDYLECMLWRHGFPTSTKIRDLHRGWFSTGVPVVVELEPHSG
jgi:deazaflavin-dependent oxidoreductase (nitroreductase family)